MRPADLSQLRSSPSRSALGITERSCWCAPGVGVGMTGASIIRFPGFECTGHEPSCDSMKWSCMIVCCASTAGGWMKGSWLSMRSDGTTGS